jgi:hypothetical protein
MVHHVTRTPAARLRSSWARRLPLEFGYGLVIAVNTGISPRRYCECSYKYESVYGAAHLQLVTLFSLLNGF